MWNAEDNSGGRIEWIGDVCMQREVRGNDRDFHSRRNIETLLRGEGRAREGPVHRLHAPVNHRNR